MILESKSTLKASSKNEDCPSPYMQLSKILSNRCETNTPLTLKNKHLEREVYETTGDPTMGSRTHNGGTWVSLGLISTLKANLRGRIVQVHIYNFQKLYPSDVGQLMNI